MGLPAVKRCYEIIHGTTELVSSCDNTFFAPEGQEAARENKVWPHSDHNSNVEDWDCPGLGDWEVYQGILYVWGSQGEHASTTVVLPESHRTAYPLMMQDSGIIQRGLRGDHFTQLRNLKDEALAKELMANWLAGARRVEVPRGGLFLWSSKTLHQGWNGGPRLAQPVCWEPTSRRSELALDRKMRLAALGLPSTHWASLGIPHYLVQQSYWTPTQLAEQNGEVVFPAKSAVQLATLRDGCSVAAMWQLIAGVPWKKPLPQELRKKLEQCLTQDILAVL